MYTSPTHHSHTPHTQVLSLTSKSALVDFATLYLLPRLSLSQTSYQVMGPAPEQLILTLAGSSTLSTRTIFILTLTGCSTLSTRTINSDFGRFFDTQHRKAPPPKPRNDAEHRSSTASSHDSKLTTQKRDQPLPKRGTRSAHAEISRSRSEAPEVLILTKSKLCPAQSTSCAPKRERPTKTRSTCTCDRQNAT